MSKLHALLPVGLCLVAGLAALRAETPTEQPADAATALREESLRATPAEREARIRATLDNPTQIEFIDNPLTEVVHFLGDLHHIQILLDEQALSEAGVATDQPLNLTLDAVSLRSALNIILDPLALTYVLENEVLLITTREAAEKRLRTAIYDVRQLEQAGVQSEVLVRLITSTVDFGNWREDGRTAVVEPISGGLVVAQTEVGHEKIGTLLRELTEFTSANAASGR